LPAQISRLVGRQINPGNTSLGCSRAPPAMALPAHVPRARLGRHKQVWLLLVLLGLGMALKARKLGVVGHGLGARDRLVTGPALGRYLWRLGLVWVVAVHAGADGIVADGVDLGESGRPRGIVPVAQGAAISLARRRRQVGIRVIGVSGCWSVADFAGDPGMPRRALCLADIIVAVDAGQLPCVADGTSQHRIDGCRPVVAQFSEGVGNQEMPRRHQGADRRHEQNHQPLYLLRHTPRSSWDVLHGPPCP